MGKICFSLGRKSEGAMDDESSDDQRDGSEEY